MSNVYSYFEQNRPHCKCVIYWIVSSTIQQRSPRSFPQRQDDARRSWRFNAGVSGKTLTVLACNIPWLTSLKQSADAGTERRNGWPAQSSYSVSKACENALTAVLARENPGLTINACCPGWVSTDMGKMVGSQPSKAPGNVYFRCGGTSYTDLVNQQRKEPQFQFGWPLEISAE